MAVLKFVIFAALCASAIASGVNIKPCEEYSEDLCTIIEYRIEPCANPARCTIKKHNNVSMSFDFTPNFDAPKARTMVFGLIGGMYIRFPWFGNFSGSKDACSYTSCPLETGKTQSLNYNMYLTKVIPRCSFRLMWKLWNEENENQVCCFKFGIRIR